MSNAFVGGPFALIDHFGRPASSERFLGRPALLYFGFTRCKVICPRALTRLSGALALADGAGERVQPLFISVDPERDTPAVMKTYLEAQYPRFLGLTGAREQIESVRSAYKVFARKIDDATEPDGYAISHTAFSYLIGADGEYIAHFADTLDERGVADRMRDFI